MDIPRTPTKARVQRNGRDTSWDAATLQTPERTKPLYLAIYAWLHTPMTDEELLANLRTESQMAVTPSGVRSRRAELVNAGWVTEAREDDGTVIKRPLASGSKGIVWRAALEGEEVPTGGAGPTAAEQAHADGLKAARRLSSWEIGTPDWADVLVQAYLNPAATNERLDEEMNDA